jgi:hypothetical protein
MRRWWADGWRSRLLDRSVHQLLTEQGEENIIRCHDVSRVYRHIAWIHRSKSPT